MSEKKSEGISKSEKQLSKLRSELMAVSYDRMCLDVLTRNLITDTKLEQKRTIKELSMSEKVKEAKTEKKVVQTVDKVSKVEKSFPSKRASVQNPSNVVVKHVNKNSLMVPSVRTGSLPPELRYIDNTLGQSDGVEEPIRKKKKISKRKPIDIPINRTVVAPDSITIVAKNSPNTNKLIAEQHFAISASTAATESALNCMREISREQNAQQQNMMKSFESMMTQMLSEVGKPKENLNINIPITAGGGFEGKANPPWPINHASRHMHTPLHQTSSDDMEDMIVRLGYQLLAPSNARNDSAVHCVSGFQPIESKLHSISSLRTDVMKSNDMKKAAKSDKVDKKSSLRSSSKTKKLSTERVAVAVEQQSVVEPSRVQESIDNLSILSVKGYETACPWEARNVPVVEKCAENNSLVDKPQLGVSTVKGNVPTAKVGLKKSGPNSLNNSLNRSLNKSLTSPVKKVPRYMSSKKEAVETETKSAPNDSLHNIIGSSEDLNDASQSIEILSISYDNALHKQETMLNAVKAVMVDKENFVSYHDSTGKYEVLNALYPELCAVGGTQDDDYVLKLDVALPAANPVADWLLKHSNAPANVQSEIVEAEYVTVGTQIDIDSVNESALSCTFVSQPEIIEPVVEEIEEVSRTSSSSSKSTRKEDVMMGLLRDIVLSNREVVQSSQMMVVQMMEQMNKTLMIRENEVQCANKAQYDQNTLKLEEINDAVRSKDQPSAADIALALVDTMKDFMKSHIVSVPTVSTAPPVPPHREAVQPTTEPVVKSPELLLEDVPQSKRIVLAPSFEPVKRDNIDQEVWDNIEDSTYQENISDKIPWLMVAPSTLKVPNRQVYVSDDQFDEDDDESDSDLEEGSVSDYESGSDESDSSSVNTTSSSDSDMVRVDLREQMCYIKGNMLRSNCIKEITGPSNKKLSIIDVDSDTDDSVVFN